MLSSRLWQLFLDSFPKILLPGLTATIPLTIISFSLALVIAVVAALVQFANIQGLKQIARFYIWIFRGTPLLVQLFVVFFGLSRVGIVLDPFPAAVIVFSLNEGAYCAETIRAALEAVPKGQLEAGLCAGLSYLQTIFRIVLPRQCVPAFPPLSNSLDLHGQGYLSGSQHHRNGNVHGNPANRCLVPTSRFFCISKSV
ncbi:MAG: amino acid ABC transporter permease [Gallintestinimicrobium sp.]